MNARLQISPGDHAPWFKAPALSGSPNYAFDTVAGRYVLMLFFGSAAAPASADALALMRSHRELFDDMGACFFGVTADPEDAASGRIAQELPGIRFFLDYDLAVSSAYGAAFDGRYHPCWLVLDRGLRVIGAFSLQDGAAAFGLLRASLAQPSGNRWAPVLLVDNIFEPELCSRLMGLYQASGGEESGFMREIDGKTVAVVDPAHKRRRDCSIQDETLRQALIARINRRLAPAVSRTFQFQPTRIERHVVACYAAGAGHFRPYRDNTTRGTAHRKFAVTINLNAADYEGGDLRFPEFGARTYRAPTGGAIVFSCSLLHEATSVTKGQRFAYLPFLYDEKGARTRERNNKYLGDGVGRYGSERGEPS